jgi:hypothetical protein
LCPSCGAKRAAELGAFLVDEVVEDVGHAQWVFTIPKMLRVYFLPPPPERAALRRRWANLIRRVYETDPLVCPRGGAEMRVIGFITEPSVIRRILDHIRRRDRVSRPPPHPQPAVAHIA